LNYLIGAPASVSLLLASMFIPPWFEGGLLRKICQLKMNDSSIIVLFKGGAESLTSVLSNQDDLSLIHAAPLPYNKKL
jgi:hypothetical protein